MHKSISTIQAPEFVNLQPLDINPLMSKCEIKVMYIGQNRNRSCISKEVATEMAKTLRGTPIVGYFIENKEDFGDHGDQMIIDGDGIKFNKLTKPYGFVSPDSKVWFQTFEDYDDFGNITTREYLMTEGYLWTEQFEEAKRVISNGNPQSMELDEKTLKGYWSEDTNKGIEFFIINDAIFSKLCILGEDVEPCFEGASVTSPQVSSNFSKDFSNTLYSMMNELKFALKGGQSLMDEQVISTIEEPVVETDEVIEENLSEDVETVAEEVMEEAEESTEETEFACKDNKDKYDEDDVDEDEAGEEETDEKNEDEDDESEKKTVVNNSLHSDEEYEALEKSYSELQEKYSQMTTEYEALVAFKKSIEDAKKDEMIESFYMLSEEDKADVIANKASYSLEDIEAKLSVICVRKKVNFDLEETDETSTKVEATIYNLTATEAEDVPAYILALRNTKNSHNE